ncbi:MAG: thiamine-phosphate kinase, partial [Acidobacteria bacterium]|nr:thiamine-phosphate kinase [Acidobacteriota bacterium]
IVADIMVVGETPRHRAILRSGARPGDEIWVTGKLGMAANGLRALQEGKKQKSKKQTVKIRTSHQADLEAFLYPQPRLRAGQYLRERKLASAMIDLSDGLSLDLARLCEESRVGASIIEASIPRASRTAMDCALHGGEDLELLFTVPARRSRQLPESLGGVRLTRIGQILSGRKLLLLRGEKERPLPVRGFQHF